jgi:photosystem II stability/assembly factor-like uncharacterized protein
MRWVACIVLACAPAASAPPPAVIPTVARKPTEAPPVKIEPTWAAINVPCAKVAALTAKSPAPKWSARASGTSEDLHAIDGSETEVYVVGNAGTVLRVTGDGYSVERCTLTEDLSAVALIDGEAWIGGDKNVYRRTAKGWFARSPQAGAISSISGTSRNDVWLIADRKLILHATNDGSTWTSDDHCIHTEHVFARMPNDVFIECAFGVQRSTDGTTWSGTAFEPHVESGLRIQGIANEVWIAGTAGILDASFDGGITFAAVDVPVAIMGIHDVWPLGQRRAIAVGTGVYTRFAKTWVKEISEDVGISAVWGSSIADVWAVGRGGTILHRP